MALTQAYLRDILVYDPKTGVWRWRVAQGPRSDLIGEIAGYLRAGYRLICIDGQNRTASHLAFLYMTGRLPNDEVDHINGIKDDDRWSNLREANHQENSMNRGTRRDNRAGVRGVRQFQGKWMARIQGQYLGIFSSKKEAAEAYRKEAQKRLGKFARD